MYIDNPLSMSVVYSLLDDGYSSACRLRKKKRSWLHLKQKKKTSPRPSNRFYKFETNPVITTILGNQPSDISARNIGLPNGDGEYLRLHNCFRDF